RGNLGNRENSAPSRAACRASRPTGPPAREVHRTLSRSLEPLSQCSFEKVTALGNEKACDGLRVPVGLSGERPCMRPGSGQSFRDCPDCPEMVVVPAGSFTMG